MIGRGFVIGLMAFTATLWTGWWLSHRKRRGVGFGFGVAAIVMTLVASLAVANASFAYLPRLGDVFGGRGQWRSAPLRIVLASSTTRPFGIVTTLPVVGDAAHLGSAHTLVWLPPQYFSDTDARFPVVYLMHGSPGAPVDWLRAAGAADAALASARAGRPAILAMPRVSRGWFDDSECVNGRNQQVESYVVRAVVPSIDTQLRTRPDREARIIAGVSAGGFCALNLGLRHRDVWGTILDLSGFDHPTYGGNMAGLFGRRSDLRRVVARNTPWRYAADLAPAPCMHVWLDSGDDDGPALRSAHRMADLLTSAGQPTQLRVRPGGHTYGVWRPALAQSMAWGVAVADGAGSCPTCAAHPPTCQANVPKPPPASAPVLHLRHRR
ncbi:MAG: hypothetical protein QOJ00_583 [Actinomycetota bacterium]